MAVTEDRRVRASGIEVDQLDLPRIREQWLAATGTPPPRYVSKTLLMRMLADRIQSARYGGLTSETRRRLLKIAASSLSVRIALNQVYYRQNDLDLRAVHKSVRLVSTAGVACGQTYLTVRCVSNKWLQAFVFELIVHPTSMQDSVLDASASQQRQSSL